MWTTWNEVPESLPITHSRQVQHEHSSPSLSAVYFWNRSELELEESRVAEFRPELALMMRKMCCRLNCFVCFLPGLRGPVAGRLQASDVSCVSHDAVLLVPGPRVLLVSRTTMKFLSVSSTPVFGSSSLQLHQSLSRRCARGFVPDLPNHIPFIPRSVSFMESPSRRQSTMLWRHYLERCSFCNWNNFLRVISVIRCPERCDATRSTRLSHDTKSSVYNQPWPEC